MRREISQRRAETGRQKRRRFLEQNLAAFVREAWPVVEPATPLEWGPHLDALCLHLEAVSSGRLGDLLVTVPPGCTKSLTVSVFWPAWSWASAPSLRWLFAANEESLALRDAVACRRLLESDWYRGFWGDAFALTSDQNVKSWYENSARGWRTSTSVGSNVTGKKGDVLVVDDPHDARKVESAAERRKVCEWWDQAFYNRVNDPRTGRRVVIGQRTHADDLMAHLLDQGGIEHLCLPEEFEPDRRCTTSLGWADWRTREGELLRPERFGPEQVEQAVRRLGPHGYAAQHQQNPTPREGLRFNPKWFTPYTRRGDTLLLPDRPSVTLARCQRFGTVDTAASQKTAADYTVICSWAVTPQADLVWLGMERGKWQVPDIVPRVQEAYRRWDLEYVGVEGLGVFQLACRTRMIVRELRPGSDDKLTRAIPAIALAESRRVFVPEDGAWVGPALAELARFTGEKGRDAHDDIVDCLAWAARQLRGGDGRRGEFTPYVLGG